MSCCMGFFKKRRGRSLPPGGTQSKKYEPNSTISQLINASLPNIDLKKDQRSNREVDSHLTSRNNEDDETLNDENKIYPAPLSFRESASADSDSEPKTRTWDQETDALRSLDQNLKKELRQNTQKNAQGSILAKTVIEEDRSYGEIKLEELQKFATIFSIDKEETINLKSENKNLSLEIGRLKSELLEREIKWKEENDFLITTVHSALSKDLKSEKEKEALANLFVSKQTEKNKALINEQSNVIEHLKLRCSAYENEIKNLVESQRESALFNQVNQLHLEINLLRNLVYRLNVELSDYQAKNPSTALKSSIKKINISSLPTRGPIPIWLINSKYLSPLIAAYDDKLKEKETKINFFQQKFDELSEKLTKTVEENNELHSKFDKIGTSYGSGEADDNELRKQIRHHAMLVLEENKTLNDQIEVNQENLLEARRKAIIEIGNLSKRIIVNEAEKDDLKNHIETLKFNYDELSKKYNDCLAESQRRVKLQDHLSQTGELKKQIEESDIYFKLENEQNLKKIENLEYEKKDLMIKNKNLLSENRKLIAENKVLDKALNDGIGRKMQRSLKDLEKRLELSEMKEVSLKNEMSHLSSDLDKVKQERDTFESMYKSSQMEVKKHENRQLEDNIKLSKLEGKLEDYKQKNNEKFSHLNEKLNKKDSEFYLNRLEYEKRINDLLSLNHKKQNEIDELIQEKRQMECELEMVWQTTTSENRRIKEALLENLRGMPSNENEYGHGSSFYKLLIDD